MTDQPKPPRFKSSPNREGKVPTQGVAGTDIRMAVDLLFNQQVDVAEFCASVRTYAVSSHRQIEARAGAIALAAAAAAAAADIIASASANTINSRIVGLLNDIADIAFVDILAVDSVESAAVEAMYKRLNALKQDARIKTDEQAEAMMWLFCEMVGNAV